MLTKMKSKAKREQATATTDGRLHGIACGDIRRDRMSYYNGKRLIVHGSVVLFAGVE